LKNDSYQIVGMSNGNSQSKNLGCNPGSDPNNGLYG